MSENGQMLRWMAQLQRKPDAAARVRGSEEYPNINGTVRFYQTHCGVLVAAEISGLPCAPGPCGGKAFGFHIHRGMVCSGTAEDPFANALTHYDNENCPHPEHAGDMPPLFANKGCAFLVFLTDRFSVCEIIHRTVIIHSAPDDFSTQPSGNSGKKIACGVIRGCC